MPRSRAWMVLVAGGALLASAGPASGALTPPDPIEEHLGFVDQPTQLWSATVTNPDEPGIAVVGAAGLVPSFWGPDAALAAAPERTGDVANEQASARSPFGNPTSAPEYVFVSTAASTGGGTQPDVWVTDSGLDPDGSGDIRLTCWPGAESHPALSRGGDFVAFAVDDGASLSIGVRPRSECTPGSVDDTRVVSAPGTRSTWPVWLSDSRLVYSSAAPGVLPDLWEARFSGPNVILRNLTNTPTIAETQPASYQPDGDMPWLVAYTTTEIRPDGSLGMLEVPVDVDEPALPLRVYDYDYFDGMTRQASEPAWSPAGLLAFTSTTEDAQAGGVWAASYQRSEFADEVYLASQSVVDEAGVAESHATWLQDVPGDEAPAGARLLFTRELPGAAVSQVVADDASGYVHLVEPLASPPDAAEALADAGLDYSPDGTRVTFSDPDTEPSNPYTGYRLTVLDVRELEPIGLEYDRSTEDIDVDPVWSHDGTRIAFTRWAFDGEGWDQPQVYVVEVESGDVTRVTGPGEGEGTGEIDQRATSPSWSADDTRLVYVGNPTFDEPPHPNAELHVVELATSAVQVLTVPAPAACPSCPDTSTVRGADPAWSPDGRQIAVAGLSIDPADDGSTDGPALAARGEPELVVPEPAAAPLLASASAALAPPVSGDSLPGFATPDGVGVLTLASATGPVTIAAARSVVGVTPGDELPPTAGIVEHAQDPRWRPDSGRLAFSGVATGQPESTRGIWEVDPADGSLATRPLVLDGVQRAPAYQPWTNLALTLASSALAPDGTATITAFVENEGPATVATAVVTFELPAGVTAPEAPPCEVFGQQVMCWIATTIAPGATARVDLAIQGVPTVGATIVVARVESQSPEHDTADNVASVEVGLAAGLSVTAQLSAPTAWVGGRPVTATITARNGGPGPAQDVVLTAAYPPTVVATGLCSSPTGPCGLGTIPAGGTVVRTVTLTPSVVFTGPPRPGVVTAAVTTTSSDASTADDTASAPLEVRAPSVTLSPAVARPGQVVFAFGADFPPGEPVTLAWSAGVMSTSLPITTGADGRWARAILLIHDGLVTARTLRSHSAAPAPAFGDVDAPLLVVANTTVAPDFLFRK